jgi:hypothetical protein
MQEEIDDRIFGTNPVFSSCGDENNQYYINYRNRNIEIFKKNNIKYEDIINKKSENKNKIIEILYNECSSENNLRNKILRNKIEFIINDNSILNNNWYYGFILMDPYSEKEIEDFEKEFSRVHKISGYEIEENLRKYLLEISREINIYEYPIFFELNVNSSPLYKIGDGGCSYSYDIDMITGDIYENDDWGTVKSSLSFLDYLNK